MSQRLETILKIRGDASSAIAALKATGHEAKVVTGQVEGVGPAGDKSSSSLVAGFSKAKMGALALGLAVAKIGQEAIGGAADWEEYETVLSNVLVSGKEQAQETLSWLEEFGKRTPYQLEEVVQATVRLSAYGLDAKQHLQVLGDTASSMGKPVMEAVEAIADAQTGEFERLKEFGIKALEVNEDIMQRFGLQADAAGKTALMYTDKSGKEQVKVVDRNNREMVTSNVEAIWNERYAGGMEKLSHTWKGTVSNFKDTVSGGLREAGMLVLPYLTEGLQGAMDKYQEARTYLKGFFSDIKEKGFTDTMQDRFGGLWADGGSLEGLKGPMEEIKKAGAAMYEDLAPRIQAAFEWITQAWENDLKPALREVKQFFLDTFKDQIAWFQQNWPLFRKFFIDLYGAIRDLLTHVAQIFAFMWPRIKDIVANAWNYIKGLITGALEVIRNVIKLFAALFTGDWQGVWEAIKGIVHGAWTMLKSTIQFGLTFIWNIVKTVLHAILGLFGSSWEGARQWTVDKFNAIKDAIWGAMQGAYDWVSQKAQAIYDFLIDKWTAAKDKTSEIWNQVKDAIWDPIKWVWDKLSEFGSFLGGLFGFEGGSAPADGGSADASNAHGGFSMTQLPGLAGEGIEAIKHRLGQWIRENVPAIGGWIADIFDGKDPAWIEGVSRMVSWLDAQVGKPYIWGGGHPPDPNLAGYDCSGLVSSALQVAGIPVSGTTYNLVGQLANIARSIADKMPVVLGFHGDLSHVGIGVLGKWWEATPPAVLGPGAAQSSWDLYGVPALARGGIITRPGVYVGGDNRSGVEAVVPLERAGEFGFGKGDEYHFHGDIHVHGVEDVDGLYRQIKGRMEQDIRRNG